MKYAINIFIMGLFAVALFAVYDPARTVDFNTYYLASKSFSQGNTVYDFKTKTTAAIAKKEGIEHYADLYYYPPFTAQIIQPLQIFPAKQAAYIWLGFSLAVLLLTLFLLIKIAGNVVPSPIIAGMLLGFIPLYSSLLGGQINPFLLCMMALSFYFFCRNHIIWGGLSAVIGGLFKYIAWIYLFYLLIQRQWKAFIICVVVGVFTFFSALPWIGFHTYQTFFTMFYKMLSWNYSNSGINLSFANGIQALLGPIKGEVLLICRFVFSIIILGITIKACWPQENQEQDITELEFGLCTITILLITPIVWYHLLVILVLPLLILIKQSLQENLHSLILLICALSYTGINIYGLLFYTRINEWIPPTRNLHSIMDGLPLLIFLSLWFCLLILLYQKKVRYREFKVEA